MKFTTATLLLPLIGAVDATVNIYLYTSGKQCTGGGHTCTNIPAGHCCSSGSVNYVASEAFSPDGTHGYLATFDVEGGGSQRCGTGVAKSSPQIPVCASSPAGYHITGALWGPKVTASTDLEHRELDPPVCVQGDPFYTDGSTAWIISNEKMARENLQLPENNANLEAFFVEHADNVQEKNGSLLSVK